MLRIRGKEATIRLQKDGQPLGGSFLKTKDFTLTPREDITEDDFLGEPETDFDIMHHGFDFNFTAHVVNRVGTEFLRDLVERDRNGLAFPRMTLVVILKYREPGVRAQSLVLPRVVMKMNELSFSDRKDYVTHAFEGKGKRISFQNV